VYRTSCSALSTDNLPVLIDTACRSSFQHTLIRPELWRTDWANFQTHLEDKIPFNPELYNKIAIDTCVEKFSGSVLKALANWTPEFRPRDDPRPPIPAGIEDEITLMNRLRRQLHLTRGPVLRAESIRLQRSVTRRLNEWRNYQWSRTLESIDPEEQSLWRTTRRVMRVPTPSPSLVTPGWIPVSDSEKSEAVADSLGTHFHPVTDPSVPTFIEIVDVALRSYFQIPASDPKLINPVEFHEAMRGLNISKALEQNSIQYKALEYISQRAVCLLVQIFNSVLRFHPFPQVWKHAREISILKPGKDPALPSSYRPISLLDTIGKLFENILLNNFLYEVNKRG